MLIRVGVLVLLTALVGCQVTPETQELLDRNQTLQNQLNQLENEVDTLAAENRDKQEAIEELNRLVDILETEKSSRVEESTGLRMQVRGFVQNQIDDLRKFLVNSELLDYIGDELIDRSWVEEDPLLLVDLDNPAPHDGALTGLAAYFNEPSPVRVKILRPIDDELVVIWESELLDIQETGLIRKEFRVSVGIDQGDYLAYYFPESTGVGFDEGTGNTRYSTRDVALGDSIRRSSLKGEDKQRAYSIGVYALLNLE